MIWFGVSLWMAMAFYSLWCGRDDMFLGCLVISQVWLVAGWLDVQRRKAE